MFKVPSSRLVPVLHKSVQGPRDGPESFNPDKALRISDDQGDDTIEMHSPSPFKKQVSPMARLPYRRANERLVARYPRCLAMGQQRARSEPIS